MQSSVLMRKLPCRGQSERGGMDTTTQATGESIVGNEGVDSDAMSTADTGFASFKAEHATLESLAAKKVKKSKGPFRRNEHCEGHCP